jgi:hypothetical protein
MVAPLLDRCAQGGLICLAQAHIDRPGNGVDRPNGNSFLTCQEITDGFSKMLEYPGRHC